MDYDAVIIGAGVVGLAIASKLSENKQRVVVVEKENREGTGISSRNSEVIHAGIYYEKNTLRSRLCLRGKTLLNQWCKRYNVTYNKIGKYVVACSGEEVEQLEKIRLKAFEAGMFELYFCTSDELNRVEPNVAAVEALYSPTSGIISAHEFMTSLKGHAVSLGCDFLFNSNILRQEQLTSSGGYRIEIFDGNADDIVELETERIINCAGLSSDIVAEILNVQDEKYKLKFVKGSYFRLNNSRGLFRHLIYPVPDSNSPWLGIHITLDLAGGLRLGPDSENMEFRIEDYSVDPSRADDFYEAVRRYFPGIRKENISPDMAGIRPRLVSSLIPRDFIIAEEKKRGLPGIINCIGIESPGLTASLAIAEYIWENLYY
jgi:L-2-hydroxyglutarate oxidase LhgO